MNTLPTSITHTFFASKDDFMAFRAHFRALAKTRPCALTSGHYALYLVLRGKDYRRALPLATNARKRAGWQNVTNGAFARAGFNDFLRILHRGYAYERQALLAPFQDWLSEETLKRLAALLPKPLAYPQTDLPAAYCVLEADAESQERLA